MNLHRVSFFIWFIVLSGWHPALNAAFSFDPSLSWQTLRTEHFNIHFHNSEEEIARRVADIAERANERVTAFFDWQPRAPTEVVLIDRMDFSNAYAMPMPRNTMNIIITPPDDIETIAEYHDWLDLVITHEYTHIVHIDKVSDLPESGRNIFGRMVFFFPNALQPLWVLEGMATYIESQIKPGIGRGHNNEFRSLMRLEVASGVKPISQVNMPIISWPSGTARYLYGVYFFNFLHERYGDETIKRWVSEYSKNLIPFFVNSNATRVFKKDLNQLWEEFRDYLKQEFEPQIAQITAEGIVSGKQITEQGYLTGYPRATSNGDILYYQQNLLTEPKLMRLPKDGSPAQEIAEIHSGRFDIHPQAGILVAQIDAYKNVNYYSDLYRIDSNSGKVTRLTEGKRYKHATWSPDAKHIVAVHIEQGQSALHLLDADGKFIKTLWQGNNHEIVSEMDCHPAGNTLVASVWRPDSYWNLELFNLDTQQWQPLTHTTRSEFQPQFIDNGQAILFSADYTDVFNIYRLELANQSITQITNVVGGALSATLSPDGKQIYYMGQNSNGSDIYSLPYADNFNKATQLTEPAPSTTTTAASTKASVDTSNTSTYSAIDKIVPTAWFPYALLTDERSEIGVSTAGADPLNWHLYSLVAAYDFKNDWLLGGLVYIYDRWSTTFKFYFQRDILEVRDSLDNVNSYRNSDNATIEAVLPHLTRDQQWSLHAGISIDRESDHRVEPGGLELPDFKDELVGLALTFNSAKYFPRGISQQDGYTWRFVAEDSDTLESDFSGQTYTLDWRGYFNIVGRHVLATRLVSGKGTDSPSPYRLGGYRKGFYLATPGATIGEPTQEVFNKREYALRGYPEGLTELRGRRMELAELEWRFPITLIERTLMAPPVGLQQLHGKLFYNIGDAWNDQTESADYLDSIGLELNAELVFGYFIPINLRLGYAHGMDDLGEDQAYLELGFTY